MDIDQSGNTNVRQRVPPPREIIPIVILLTVLLLPWVIVNLLQSPSPFYREYDPEIQYFMNSLLVFKGHTYYYVDHPGTPVEAIGTILLALTYPFMTGARGGFIDYQLRNPNLFLTLARLFVTICSIGCAIFMRRTVAPSPRRFADMLMGIAVPLMFFDIHPEAFATLTTWSHASFNFPLGTLLLVIMYRAGSRKTEPSAQTAGILGFLCGILASVMVYFSAWIVGLVVFVVTWYRLAGKPWRTIARSSIIIAAWGTFGFAVMLLPGIRRIAYLLDWMKRLTFHQGIYGAGPQGITSVPLMVAGFQNLASTAAPLLILSGLAGALFLSLMIWRRHVLKDKAGLCALGVGILVQMILLVLLAMKHPMDRYLLPLAAALPVLAMVIFQLLPHGTWLRQVVTWAIVLCTLAYIPVSLKQFVTDQYGKLGHIREVERQEQQAITDYLRLANKQAGNVLILWTYGVYSPCYSLQFGNEYAWSDFSAELSSICPQQYQFNIWDQTARLGTKRRPLNSLNWDLLLTTRQILEGYPYLAEYGTVVEYPYEVVAIHPKQVGQGGGRVAAQARVGESTMNRASLRRRCVPM